MKRYDWALKDGRKVTLEADYTETVQDELVNLDGDICATGKRKIVKKAMLTVYLDGQKIDSCYDPNFWRTIETGKPGIKKIWGIKMIAFTAERAAEIDAFFAAVIEAGRSEEAQQIRESEKDAEEAQRSLKRGESLQRQSSRKISRQEQKQSGG